MSTMAVLYGSGGLAGISEVITSQFSAVSAYAFMVFVLLYTPCVAAVSAIHREMKSFKWTATAIGYQLALAWFMSVLVFQVGTLVFNIF